MNDTLERGAYWARRGWMGVEIGGTLGDEHRVETREGHRCQRAASCGALLSADVHHKWVLF